MKLADNFHALFGGRCLHLVDHRRGKYPFEVLRDLGLYDARGNLVLAMAGRRGERGQQGFKEGYRTDLASIPTKALKALLEPMRGEPWDGKELLDDSGLPVEWMVYIWLEDEDGELVPDRCFRDPVGYAAVPHDKGYSTELHRKLVVDRWFFHILTVGQAPGRRIMFLAVLVGGWPSFPHPIEEVTEDRLLAVEAADRLGPTIR